MKIGYKVSMRNLYFSYPYKFTYNACYNFLSYILRNKEIIFSESNLWQL